MFALALLGVVNCRAAAPTVLASNQGSPGDLLVDGSSVYWVDNTSHLISSVSKNPGGVVTHYSTLATLGDPAMDNVFLYYLAWNPALPGGQILKVPKTGGFASAIGNANVTNALAFAGIDGSGDLAIGPAGGVIYYEGVEDLPNNQFLNDLPTTVESVSTGGGANNILIYAAANLGTDVQNSNVNYWLGATANAQRFTTDSTYVYWTDSTNIWRMPLAGGIASAIVSGRSNIGYFATPTTGGAGGSIFWVENAGGNITLKRREASGQIITVLSGLSSDAHRCFAVENNTVYSEKAFTLVSVSINGGATTTLAGITASGFPVGVAADSSYVYWSTLTGQITADKDHPQISISGAIMRLAISSSGGGGGGPPPVNPPVIQTPPASLTVKANSNAVFKVTPTAQSGATYAYQWQRLPNGTSVWANVSNTGPYSGVTTASLTVKNATPAMSGDQFRCIVTDSAGPTTSSSAKLLVQSAPAITLQPVATSVHVTQPASFVVVATGVPTPTYQWQRFPVTTKKWAALTNGSAYANVTTPALTLPNTTLAMSGDQFDCVVKNSLGSVTSKAATLTVTLLPAGFAQSPSGQTITFGNNTSFTASPIGVPAPTLQWQISTDGGNTWSNLTANATFSGGNTSTLAITNATLAMNGEEFQLIATNSVGTATSNPATLTVNAKQGAIAFSFQTLDDPNAVKGTYATGISGGNIVGYYFDANSVAHGFIFNGSSYTTADDPSASTTSGGTWVTGIDGTNIVGYINYGASSFRAYVLGGGFAALLDFPGAPSGISGGNILSGSFIYNIANITATNLTGFANYAGGYANGISGGNIVGSTYLNSHFYGFAYNLATTTFATIDDPAAATGANEGTQVNGVDGGNLVGDYYGNFSNGNDHRGFLYESAIETFFTINDPNAVNANGGTVANAISGGNIVGYYTDVNNQTHGFLAFVPVPTAPAITTPPANLIIYSNITNAQRGNFTIAASGYPAPACQWQLSTNAGNTWSNLTANATYSGVANATLQLANVTFAMSGNQYRVLAANALGSVISPSASLFVGTLPAFTTQPVGQPLHLGNSTTFTIAATAIPTPSFLWQVSPDGVNWSNLADNATFSGAATPTLAVNNVTADLNGEQFQCLATNLIGSTASLPVTLDIFLSPAIITQPANLTMHTLYIVPGTFTVAVNAYPAPTCQWQISTNSGATWNNLSDSSVYSGSLTLTLSISNPVTTMSGSQYRCVITNTLGSVTSNAATITVMSGGIIAHPII